MKPNHIIEAHSSHVNRAIFTPDGKSVISFGFSGELWAWDASDWSLQREYEGHAKTVNCGVIYNNSLISVSLDGKINFNALDTGKLIHTVEDHKKGVGMILKTADDQYLLTSGPDRMVVVRDMEGKPLHGLKPTSKNIGVKTVTPDGKHVLVGGLGSQLKVFTIPELEEVADFEVGDVAITSVRCHPAGEKAWALDYSGNLNVIDLKNWAVTDKVPLKRKGVFGMAYAPGRNELAITADKAVLLLDADSFTEKQVLTSTAKGNYGVSYSPDESRLALASADKRVRIWEL